MARKKLYICWLMIYFIITSVYSCVDMPSTREMHVVDSLNTASYNMRYLNVGQSYRLAYRAFHSCESYDRGQAEALNNMAFCDFIRMNYEKAEQLYRRVGNTSKNEIEQLIADIGLMKIYQRTSMNVSFYNRRNSARRRMKLIDQDSYAFFSPHDTQRINYAYSEFNIASAIYYYYLRQHDDAVAAISSINPKWIASDSCQWMYTHYIKGSGGLCYGATEEDKQLNCFDELFRTWEVAHRHNNIYFLANSLQSLSGMVTTNDALDYFMQRRRYMLQKIGMPLDTLLSLRMAEKSLMLFRQYGDPYQISSSDISIAQYYNAHGRYRDALNIMVIALNGVNKHHRLYYHHHALNDELLPFAPLDTMNRELRWISTERTKTVPEWILSIREQLSVAYAGLGMKQASDYNRNAYLDILNYTRQDKELESRYKGLQSELKTLNVIFIITIISAIMVILLLYLFNKRAKQRDLIHTERLKRSLDECRKITMYTSEQAEEKIKGLSDLHSNTKDERVMKKVMMPYLSWVMDNRKTLLSLSEEHERLEKKQYLSQQHIIENKRSNITKKAFLSIVNGINPYIDRIVNEVRKLKASNEKVKKERLHYIDELVTTINDYNDILTHWIKVKQGTVSLNIETFELNDLFALIEKGRHTFEMKGQHFNVESTDAVVKADKALTLFMINTLAENARKYTAEGGTISVGATISDKYVEISVQDTGRGLSEEDIHRILDEKVYDSKQIGINDGSDVQTLQKNKGSGFGLMNCKGIIEKYRKTNSFFEVCKFCIESRLGEGSRFFFRLPKGIRRTMFGLLCLCMPFTLLSCNHEDEMKARDIAIDSIAKIEKQPGFEVLLNKASHYADMTYYNNVDHHYEQALMYADSAIICLNEHYRKYSKHPRFFMQLVGKGTPAELEWWNRMFDSDFHIILDIRNESAVAFLALKKLEGYQYNNDAYTSLYKLLGEDKTLNDYCRHLQRSTTDKTVELAICLLLVLIAASSYYFLFVRKRVINRMNLKQVFIINEKILKASLQSTESPEEVDSTQGIEDSMNEVPKHIVEELFDAMNELVPIERIALAVYGTSTQTPVFVANPPLDTMPEDIQICYENLKPLYHDSLELFPLLVDTIDGQRCVGVLYLETRKGLDIGNDRLLVQLIAEYMAVVVLNSVLNMASNYMEIETVHEEIDRSSYEDNMLHVQNMVLDNCLSTIKHETVYYPNKIKQIVGKMETSQLNKDEEEENIRNISELVDYYRGIYTILNSCAVRQLEGVTFRRNIISAVELCDYAVSYFAKVNTRNRNITLTISPKDIDVIGDKILLMYLLENLIDVSLTDDVTGNLYLRVGEQEDFVRFDYTDTRHTFTVDQLNNLFYPKIEQMNYLICRQIIREHDEYGGLRGCRINAEQAAEGGFTIYFTLTKNKIRYGRKEI